jgi:hypothetical protein
MFRQAAARLTMAAVLAAVAPALGACSGGESHGSLKALQADPLARFIPPGSSEVHVVKTKSGTSLGKPRHAELIRELSAPGGVGQASLDAVASQARAAGWQVNQNSTGSYSGTKMIGDMRARFDVVIAIDRRPATIVIDLASLD